MSEKSEESDFTYQEILRQQAGWKKAIVHWHSQNDALKSIVDKFKDRIWVFSGCGTSYYLAQTASSLFELITGIRSLAVPASEVLTYPEIVFNPKSNYLFIPLSRSGTTTETVKAAEIARDLFDIPTFAISCNSQSAMSTQSQDRLEFPFETERSVVMTGSFTTMLLSIIYLAAVAANDTDLLSQLNSIPDASFALMTKNQSLIQKIAANRLSQEFVFLGQGPMLGIANEASLKMQEMTISVSHAFHALEYRHGPMSTATQNTLICILCCQPALRYEIPLVKDLKKLGANILVFHSHSNGRFSDFTDYEINIKDEFSDLLKPLLFMPLLQMLAYYRAKAKNINPDTPKNLSQVVELSL
ncbi:MAG: SIS domain-containing protein [Calditrichaeota bacterium]|nr:SIS domain-containing protein [Calditrichota bacterium]